ncbi:hypothetical protein ANRL1_04007 [Anaerolineae bacterium]|nr:hypothetical protein ANRL1_04007 [Anaerolineae bacterium]
MPKRSAPKATKRDWRWWLMTGLNGLVVLSMVIGTFLIFAPPPAPRANVPTIEVPTLAPTPVPSPTPKVIAFANSILIVTER